MKVGTEEPYFTPYVIQTKEVVDSQGKTHKLNIGYIGFVPPQIMVWDKANLQGKVETDVYKRQHNQCTLPFFRAIFHWLHRLLH